MTDVPLTVIRGGRTQQASASDRHVALVVEAAVAGDERAVTSLVARYDRTLRSLARSYGLGPWDVDDVIQSTWVQFLEYGASLREPAAVSGWLKTTARRQCLRMLQRHVREDLCEDPANQLAGDDDELAAEVLAGETRAALATSLTHLSDGQRQLMTLLLAEPGLSYEEIGRRLGLPIGSIGPTRARSLTRLRRSTQLRALR
jgi:RNA polymerase sigma factor (sigma-70 family)